jgi:hypothetical protein
MSDGLYYFNRCRRCNSLITKLQLQRAFSTDGVVCSCGSGMFGPTNPLWYEWLYPRVLRMSLYQLLGWLEPAPEPSQEVPKIFGGRPVPALSDAEKSWGVEDEE